MTLLLYKIIKKGNKKQKRQQFLTSQIFEKINKKKRFESINPLHKVPNKKTKRLMSRIGRLIESFMIDEKAQNNRVSYDEIRIPSEMQILQMFEKNGFRASNVVTRNQLEELFDRQYAMNNLDELGEKSNFSRELFEQLWGHLQLLSDSTAKIENISKVLSDALSQLQRKIKLINGSQGISRKKQTLQELLKKQQELTQQLDNVDGEYEYHQENIKSERNTVRMSMGKLRAQISELERDRGSFEAEFKMLIVTIGVHESVQTETKVIVQQGLMSMVGVQRKQYSGGLKFIFVLTTTCIIMQMFVLSYRLSFFNILGYLCILYILFLGYYTDKSIIYLIIYLAISILFDLSHTYLSLFTTVILNPIVFTGNVFLKYVASVIVLVEVIARVVLVARLLPYREIPRNLQYFDFWGEEVVLNRRNKQFQHVSLH